MMDLDCAEEKTRARNSREIRGFMIVIEKLNL